MRCRRRQRVQMRSGSAYRNRVTRDIKACVFKLAVIVKSKLMG